MLTEDDDLVFSEFKKRLEFGLTEADYQGPQSARELDLPDDLITSLIEIVFSFLLNCLASGKTDPEKLAKKVKRLSVIQQMFINAEIRKTIFKNDLSAYLAAGGGKLSNALVYTLKQTEEPELVDLAKYVASETDGLTVYPEF
jgi:hypothetical protein